MDRCDPKLVAVTACGHVFCTGQRSWSESRSWRQLLCLDVETLLYLSPTDPATEVDSANRKHLKRTHKCHRHPHLHRCSGITVVATPPVEVCKHAH